jgi:hypothetical protein
VFVGSEQNPAGDYRTLWFNEGNGEIRDLGDGIVIVPIQLNENGFFLYWDSSSGESFIYNPNIRLVTFLTRMSFGRLNGRGVSRLIFTPLKSALGLVNLVKVGLYWILA